MRQRPLFKQEKGVAGLNVLLSIIILLFVIGFIVMIFALLSGEMEQSVWKETTNTWFTADVHTETVVNETGAYISVGGQFYRDSGVFHNFRGFTVVNCSNYTEGLGTDPTGIVMVGNWSYHDTGLINYTSKTTTSLYNNSLFNCTGSFVYDANNTASDVISETKGELSEVTDWFSIIIVIGAMVVLILLTVIIISAIRGTGLVGGMSGGGTAFTGTGKPPKTTA